MLWCGNTVKSMNIVGMNDRANFFLLNLMTLQLGGAGINS